MIDALAQAQALADEIDLDGLRCELDHRDAELVRLIGERGALARRLAEARARAGGTRFVHEHELATVRRFRQLGPVGADLAALLLRLSRAAIPPSRRSIDAGGYGAVRSLS